MSQFGYIERQIEGLSRFLAKTIFQKELASDALIDENGVVSTENFLQYTLFQMVDQGCINEAEKLLFDQIKASPREEYLPIVLAFYDKLNKLDDQTLADYDFSRTEIMEGLAEVQNLFRADL